MLRHGLKGQALETSDPKTSEHKALLLSWTDARAGRVRINKPETATKRLALDLEYKQVLTAKCSATTTTFIAEENCSLAPSPLGTRGIQFRRENC